MISPLEISITLIAYLIGVGILTLPGALANTLDTPDGWLTLLAAGFPTMVLTFLYVNLQKHFPGRTFLQYLRQGKVGKWWAFIFGASFIVYFVTILGWEARMLYIVLDMYVLGRTPPAVIIASVLLVTSYAVTKGLSGIIHINVLFLPIILFVLLFIFLFNIGQASLDQIRPVAPKGILHVLKAFPDVFIVLVGSEILMLLMAHMRADKLRAWPLNTAVAGATLAYILVTLFTYFIFSVDEAKVITFATVELAKVIEIPGGFFERIESMMIIVWTMSLFTTMIIAQLLTTHILKDQFFSQSAPKYGKQTKDRLLTPVIVFISIIIAFIPESIIETFQLGDWLGILALSILIGGLFIGYITVWWRKRAANKVKEQHTL